MSGPDRSEDFDALRDLADARFDDWCSRELRSEENSRFAELKKQKLTGGRALHALRITQEFLTRKVRKRIALYHSVARKHPSGDMLSTPRLDEFREGIMRLVSASLSSLRSRTRRQANAVGYPQSALPSELRYDHVRAEILTIVNTALARLNAEGNVHSDLPDRSAPESPDDWRASKPLASDGLPVTDLSAAARRSRLVEVPHFTPSPFTSEFWDAFRQSSASDKRGILKQWLANRETAPDGSEAATVLDEQIGQLTAALTNGNPPVLDSAVAQIRPLEGAVAASPFGDIGQSDSNAARFRAAGVDPVAQERRAALLEFKAKGKRLGIKITDPMVAQAASPKWNDRTMVTWWKRNDDGCKPFHDRRIRAVLAKDPAIIWQPGGDTIKHNSA
jgi:hypothetical protein